MIILKIMMASVIGCGELSKCHIQTDVFIGKF